MNNIDYLWNIKIKMLVICNTYVLLQVNYKLLKVRLRTMPPIKLSKTTIATLKFSGKTEVYFDTKITGFGVRVNAQSKSYFVQTRCNGEPLKYTIGKTDKVKFEKAVEIAENILADASIGITPAERAEEKDRIKKVAKEITLEKVLAEYLTAKKTIKAATRERYKVVFNRYIPTWLPMSMDKITWQMVLKRHAEIGANNGEAAANFTFSVLRTIFNFALEAHENGVLKNPCNKLKVLGAWYKNKRRKRSVRPQDLPQWWKSLESLCNPDTRDLWRFLLFTGVRVGEAVQLEWPDLDLVNGIINFREELTKADRQFDIPLSKYIWDMLKKRHADFGQHKYVFSCDGKPVKTSGIEYSVYTLEKINGFRIAPHDCRRTFISYASSLRIPMLTIKRLANHAPSSDVTSGYIVFYIDDLRRDIEQIAAYILKLAGEKTGKVIPMRAVE
jgi:integrase